MTYEEKERHRKRRRFKVRERKDWTSDRARKKSNKLSSEHIEELYAYKVKRGLPLTDE